MKFKQIKVNCGDHSKLVIVRDDHKEKPKFTKGPWHAFEQNGSNPKTKGLFAITAPHESGSQQTVAVTPFAGDGNELWGNARLIAAAPELFEQCKLFDDVLTELAHEGEPEAMEMRNELRELLAKVEGEKCDISLDDKFECEQCGRVDDIEESRQLGGRKGVLVCGGCVEGEK